VSLPWLISVAILPAGCACAACVPCACLPSLCAAISEEDLFDAVSDEEARASAALREAVGSGNADYGSKVRCSAVRCSAVRCIWYVGVSA
jgi:hypothetical protein